MIDPLGIIDIPECVVCGEVAPLTEEAGSVIRLLFYRKLYEDADFDELFAHASCFAHVAPYVAIESPYDPAWRDRAFRLRDTDIEN